MFSAQGTTDVQGFFLPWFRAVHELDLRFVYERADSGYPPLPFILLKIADWFREAAGISFESAFKLSLLVPWLAACGFLLTISRNLALTSVAALAFGWNSIALGYLDIWTGIFLLPALYFFARQQQVLFYVLFTLASLTKFQPLIAAPFLGLYVVQSAWSDKRTLSLRLLACVLAAAVVALPLVVPFWDGLLRALQKALHHPFLSGNALNVNWLLTWALHHFWPARFGASTDGLIGLILTQDWRITMLPNFCFWAAMGLLFWSQWRRPTTSDNALAHAACALLAYCTFKTGVHENHWIYPVFFLAILAARVPAARPYFIFWAFAATYNLFQFYGVDGRAVPGTEVVAGIHVSVLAAMLYLVAFFATLRLCRPAPATNEATAASSQ